MINLPFLTRLAMHHMRQRADAARDNREYAKAAWLYEKVLSYTPNDAAIHVQCGHMLKEAGELERAEQHYNKARVLMPNDPDLALQFGHFYKVAGRLGEAELSYRRAAELMPGAVEPANELTGLLRNRWSNSGEHASQRFTAPPPEQIGSRRVGHPQARACRRRGIATGPRKNGPSDPSGCFRIIRESAWGGAQRGRPSDQMCASVRV